jgi:hypothetical protein
MKIDGVEVVAGELYTAGEDYERDVLVLGRKVADEIYNPRPRSLVKVRYTSNGCTFADITRR